MNWKFSLLLLPLALVVFVGCGEKPASEFSMEEIQQKLDSLEQRNRDLQRELDQQKEGIASKDATLKKVLVELETDRQKLKAELDERQKEIAENQAEEVSDGDPVEEETVSETEETEEVNESDVPAEEESVGLSEIEKTEQVKLIKAFYELLEVGEIEKAFNMRIEDDVPLEAFNNWYGTITEIRPRSFEEGDSENQFAFLVDYSDGDTRGALYRVVMEVVDEDKVKVIASWKLEGGEPISP